MNRITGIKEYTVKNNRKILFSWTSPFRFKAFEFFSKTAFKEITSEFIAGGKPTKKELSAAHDYCDENSAHQEIFGKMA